MWPTFIGRFHLLVLHLPIGILFLIALLEFAPGRAQRKAVSGLAVGALAASAIAAALLGWILADGGSYDGDMLQEHAIAGFGVVTAALAVVATHRRQARGGRAAFRASLLIAVLLTAVTGHLGASLTHGPGFLEQAAPPSVKSLLTNALGKHERARARGAAPPKEVASILTAKCAGCHGPAIQQANLRLDRPGWVMPDLLDREPPAVVPGDPAAGEIARRILLPPDRPEAMPPPGAQSLTWQEQKAILEWLQRL